MSSARILIVEDDNLIAEALYHHLRHRGYQVVGQVETGPEAIECAQRLQPDLVIMDIVLAGDMDGIEAATEIGRRVGIPVLYLTAHADTELFERAKLSGPFGYMLKPLNERELELTIEVALYRAKMDAELRSSQRHLAEAQRVGMLGSFDWDIRSNVVHWSDQMYRIFGQDPDRFAPTFESVMERVHADDRPLVQEAIQMAVSGEKHFCMGFRVIGEDGAERHVQAEGEIRHDAQRQPLGMLGTVQDVSALKQHERELRRLAYHDALTGLPNRILLQDRLQQALAHARRERHQVAVMVLDLDGFKAVNDQYGHDIGDLLLVEVAERLRQSLREGDTVARMGGDEFIVIASGLGAREHVERVTHKLLNALKPGTTLEGIPLQISASIGVALYPTHGTGEQTLFKTADQAMYAAKRAGKNRFHIHETEEA